MLRLSAELGQDVWLASGRPLGNLIDLTISLRDAPVVRRLLVRQGRGPAFLVPWADVASFEHSLVQLATNDVPPANLGEDGYLDGDEVLLGRDVLDTQIVDLAGHRFVRVGEVLLSRQADESLLVAAVDVGFGAVARRLGLRRTGARLSEAAVAWSDLHLTSNRAHDVQLATPSALVHRLDPAGLSELLARVTAAHAADVMQHMPVARAAAAIHEAHDDVAHRLLLTLPEAHAADVLDALDTDEASRHRRRLHRARVPGRRFHRTRGWRPSLSRSRGSG